MSNRVVWLVGLASSLVLAAAPASAVPSTVPGSQRAASSTGAKTAALSIRPPATDAMRTGEASVIRGGGVRGQVRRLGAGMADADLGDQAWSDTGSLFAWIPLFSSEVRVFDTTSGRQEQLTEHVRRVAWFPNQTRLVVDVDDAGDNSPGQVMSIDITGGASSVVSSTATGEIGDNLSLDPSVSPAGRFVAFQTYARNLGATSDNAAIVIKDLTTGALHTVASGSGAEVHGWSHDGRYLAFTVAQPGRGWVPFVYDSASHATNVLVGVDTFLGWSPVDDRFAYQSRIRKGVGARGSVLYRMSVRDIQSATDVCVSCRRGADANTLGPQGSNHPWRGWSPSGRWIVFQSSATNLSSWAVGRHSPISLYMKDLTSGRLRLISSPENRPASTRYRANMGEWAPTGRYYAFSSHDPRLVAGDTNGDEDVFLLRMSGRQLYRASTNNRGRQLSSGGTNPAWSHDGQWLSFSAGNRVAIKRLGL